MRIEISLVRFSKENATDNNNKLKMTNWQESHVRVNETSGGIFYRPAEREETKSIMLDMIRSHRMSEEKFVFSLPH